LQVIEGVGAMRAYYICEQAYGIKGKGGPEEIASLDFKTEDR